MQQQGEAQQTSVVCAKRLAWHSVVLERIPIHMLGPAPSVGTMAATMSAHVATKVSKYLWLLRFKVMAAKDTAQHVLRFRAFPCRHAVSEMYDLPQLVHIILHVQRRTWLRLYCRL